MSGNTFGMILRLTTYGESHGPGLGGILDGCPPRIPVSEEMIQAELDLRKPGQGSASTARKEGDRVRILSGVFEGLTTGTPIAFHIENQDQRSRDYSKIKDVYRPGHADITYDAKYGIRDYRGGGRSSGRETVSRVAGGAIAGRILAAHGINVYAFTLEFGSVRGTPTDPENAFTRPFYAPDPDIVPAWEERVREVKARGDTIGGIVEIRATGLPAGLGEPVFDKLDARLAYALMGVGAVKGVEIGSGFAAAGLTGSRNNDAITPDGYLSNNAGGILGGISNGDTLVLRAAVKPIPSVSLTQDTVDVRGEPAKINVGGRHDICAIPRINPVLVAMTRLVLADALLMQKRISA